MSDDTTTELERLRENLKAMEHVQGLWLFSENFRKEFHRQKDKIAKEIAALEAAADPWRDAKTMIEGWRKDILSGRHISPAGENAVHLFDHLSAENARLEKRVAELEAAEAPDEEIGKLSDEQVDAELKRRGIDVSRAFQRIRESIESCKDQSLFEGPYESFEPVLDPSRVLATAETMGWGRVLAVSGVIKPPNARPYRLKGADE